MTGNNGREFFTSLTKQSKCKSEQMLLSLLENGLSLSQFFPFFLLIVVAFWEDCPHISGPYRKFRKLTPRCISPSKYKPPKTGNAKNPPLNCPSKYKPPGAYTWKIALRYKVKQSKNGKFTSSYKASPIDFETQISLRR